MEAERKTEEKKERQVSEKNTPFNIKERKVVEATTARANNPALMRLYNAFMPGIRNFGPSKFVTDKYGNRILNTVKRKEKK